MLKRVLLSALVLTGCTKSKSESGQRSTLEWKLPANQSLAYRFTGEGSAVVDGKDQGGQEFSSYVFIDVDRDGRAHITLEAGASIFGSTSMALEAGSSNFFFPLPESPVGGDPVVQSLTIEGLGTTSTNINPDLEISETLTRTGKNGEYVTLTFSRKGKAAGETPLKVEIEEEGEGIFDAKAGRYQRLERTTKMRVRGDVGEASMDMALTVELELEYDPERSRARTKETAMLREPPVSPQELAKYLEANPAEAEIARALRSLDGGRPGAVLFFHVRANPVATWKEAMELPAEERDAFVSGVSLELGMGTRLPQALVDWLRAELPEEPALEYAVAHMQDERLREQLVALSSIEDPDKEHIARRAKDSLSAIDAQKAGPKALLTADERELMQIGHALQAEGQDQRGLVPVLIQLLEKSAASKGTSKMPPGDIYVQWLEGLTSRSYGKDVKAWKAFWSANQDRPYCQWLIDAAAQDTPILVQNALTKLAACESFREATDYLATRAKNDTGDTRHLAALSLAEHKDRRAIPVLLEMLAGDNPQLRAMALVALAHFRDTTLGYEPEGDQASRAASLRRWRAWAKD